MLPDSPTEPLVTFGVVTDIQYADCENRPAVYDSTKHRFYRESLEQIDRAFEHWKKAEGPVSFALQLGDIIDGLNRSIGGSHSALEKTLSKFENHHSIPTFHTVGNHELYNFKRIELAHLFYKSVAKMNIPPQIFTPLPPPSDDNAFVTPILFYKFCPTPQIKFISLDCFDVSVLGYEPGHPQFEEAANILRQRHGHDNFPDWDCDGPLKGLELRFQQMNGAVGDKQLLWLEEELAESDRMGQKVVVFGHVSLSPQSTHWSCLLWNYDKVMSCFHNHHCVIAYFSGHSHCQGYSVDSHGIHYVVFAGIVETSPNDVAFATISVYQDRLEITGHGREKSYSLPFASCTNENSDNEIAENESAVSPSTYSIRVEV